MLQSVPNQERTTQEELNELTKQLSNICFEVGRCHQEIRMQQQAQADWDVKFDNTKKMAQELQKRLAKENAVKAAPAPSVEDAQPVVN